MQEDAAEDVATREALAAVGPRLRDVRTRRGLGQAEVAAQAGVSVSTLSRLESGQRRPSLDLLLPLARVYRMPLDDLVGAPATGDPRIHLKPHRRRSGTLVIPLGSGGGTMQAFKMVLPGREPGPLPPLVRHEGFEWLYVLRGPLVLALDEDVTVLRTGEAAEFDTRRPHALVSGSSVPAELIALFGPQGERVHVTGDPAD